MHLGLGQLGLTHVQQAGGGGGEPVLESIDFADNTELPEYVNNDVTEVQTYINFSGCSSLTNFECSSLRAIGTVSDGDVNFSDCALPQAIVDAILVQLASFDGTNGTTPFEDKEVNLSGGTNAIPSAVGLDAKSTLEGRGNTVTVNTPTPVLSNPTGIASGAETADLSVSTDVPDGTLNWVVTQSATAPTKQQVNDGQNHLGDPADAASQAAVIAIGQQNVEAMGLVGSTEYWAHFMHESESSNMSDVVSSASFIIEGVVSEINHAFGEDTEYVDPAVMIVEVDVLLNNNANLLNVAYEHMRYVGGDFNLTECVNLSDFDVDELEVIVGTITFTDCHLLDWNLSALRMAGSIVGGTAALVSPDLSSLETMTGPLELNNCPLMTTLPLTALVTAGNISANSNGELLSFLVPLLEEAGGINASNNDKLPVINFSALRHAVDINCANSAVLTTITVPVLIELEFGFFAHNCALSQATVDAILEKLASLDGTGDTTLYENQEVSLNAGTNAIPSVAGLTAKATLEGRGCTVTVNS